MNPAYFLAIKLGIPVIVQPEWNKFQKIWEEGWELRKKGNKLWYEGHKIREEWVELRDEGHKIQEEGWKLWKEGEKLLAEGRELYQEAIVREIGSEYVDQIDWGMGEVRPL